MIKSKSWLNQLGSKQPLSVIFYLWFVFSLFIYIFQFTDAQIPRINPFKLEAKHLYVIAFIVVTYLAYRFKNWKYSFWSILGTAVSTFLSRPTTDDSYYVNTSQAISERGVITNKDSIISDGTLENFFPEREFQIWEKFLGLIARLINAQGSDVVYFSASIHDSVAKRGFFVARGDKAMRNSVRKANLKVITILKAIAFESKE